MVTVHIVYAFIFGGAKVLQKNNTAGSFLEKVTNTTEFGAFCLFNRPLILYYREDFLPQFLQAGQRRVAAALIMAETAGAYELDPRTLPLVLEWHQQRRK